MNIIHLCRKNVLFLIFLKLVKIVSLNIYSKIINDELACWNDWILLKKATLSQERYKFIIISEIHLQNHQ